MTAAELTDEELDWAKMIALDLARDFSEMAAKLLEATWPDDTDAGTIAGRIANIAKLLDDVTVEIRGEIGYQRIFHAMPDTDKERVWQFRNSRGASDSPLQPKWKPKVFERPTILAPATEVAVVDRTIEMELVDEDPATAEWLRPPQIDPPPKTRRALRRERRLALRKAEIA